MKTVHNNIISNTTTNKHNIINGKYICISSHLLFVFIGAILIKIDIYDINDIIDNSINNIKHLGSLQSIEIQHLDDNNNNNRRRHSYTHTTASVHLRFITLYSV